MGAVGAEEVAVEDEGSVEVSWRAEAEAEVLHRIWAAEESALLLVMRVAGRVRALLRAAAP